MNAALVMFKSDGERREFPLNKPKIVIGRKPTCDLRIPLSSVSRQHCQIELTDDGLVCRDLGSSNGTFYNGERLTEAELSAGDRLDVGPVHFFVVIDGEPADIEPVKTVIPSKAKAGVSQEAADASPDTPKPQPKPIDAQEEDLPFDFDEEMASPTTDIDDPIAALQSMELDDSDTGEDVPLEFDDDDDDQDKSKG